MEEKKLEEIEKKISKIKYKQKVALTTLNDDFMKNFNDFIMRIQPEVIETLMEFFGFRITPYTLLKRIIKDENEMKGLIEVAEMIKIHSISNMHYYNTTKNYLTTGNISIELKDFNDINCLNSINEEAYNEFIKTKIKIINIKDKNLNTLQYPFNYVLDYIIAVYDLFELTMEKEKLNEKISKVKLFIFI